MEQLGTPTEVYRHPTTAFVARFVGSMNEFDAEVSGGGEVTIGGLRVGVPKAAELPVGATIGVLVRPRTLRSPRAGLQERWPPSPSRLDHVGRGSAGHARPTGQRGRGQGAADRLQMGDRVAVSIDGSNAVCEAR